MRIFNFEFSIFNLLIVLLSLFTFTLTLTLASPAFAQVDPCYPPSATCVNGRTVPLGKITPPQGAVTIQAGTTPSDFVSTLVKNSLSLMLIVSFVIALIWTIINGLRFILAQGDEKTVASAWSQISWTLIGMVVILGSFAIIKLVETFFGVSILSTGLKIPQLQQ